MPATITGDEIATLVAADVMGSPQVDVTLTDEGSTKLAAMTKMAATEAHPRDQIAIYAEGVVVSAPAVPVEITSGHLSVGGFTDLAAAQQFVREMTGSS